MSLSNQATASPRQLYQGQPGTAATLLYTAPALNANVTGQSSTAYLKELVICNTASTSATINFFVVPSGGVAGVANAFIYGLSLSGNDCRVITGLDTFIPPG